MITRPGAENWQDHWCPAYFPLVGAVEVQKGDMVCLKVTHSELHVMCEVLSVERATSSEFQQHIDAGVLRSTSKHSDFYQHPCHVCSRPPRHSVKPITVPRGEHARFL